MVDGRRGVGEDGDVALGKADAEASCAGVSEVVLANRHKVKGYAVGQSRNQLLKQVKPREGRGNARKGGNMEGSNRMVMSCVK